jgi:hypothetical protein
MNETLEYIRTFARFPFGLRRYLQHRLTYEDAQRIVREQLERREENFLRLVEKSIYGYPRSPYLPLLKMAGCELGDLRASVQRKGLEGALRELRESGVYITFEEFKGRKPIVRNGQTIPVKAQDFDNPFTRHDLTLQTGGSSGAAVNVGVDLDHVGEQAPHEMLTLSAHGMLGAPSIRWNGILPTGALRNILRALRFGHVPERWFSPTGLRSTKSWVKYGLATYYILFWIRLYGVRAPLPEYVRVEQAQVVARAIADILQKHGRCMINTPVSCAVRACIAAQEAGIDLTGATFNVTSEPPTPAKVRQIRNAGARHLPTYAMVEANRIASGCATSDDANDVHLFKDAFALFAHPYLVEGMGVTVPAFNLTTLLSSAPKLMLNVQMDDYGIVEERHCGCELESYGYTTHLREIRSYSKLTGEGVTLIGNEILRVLEETLPARFGGSPLDYQLMEQEDEQGFTRLYLVVSPRLQIADESQVIEVMLQALSASSSMADAARSVWQKSQTLQIKRIEPIRTARGKLLPLHTLRRTPGV